MSLMKNTTNTIKKQTINLKPWLFAMLIPFVVQGCTSDDIGEVKVIEEESAEKKAEKEKEQQKTIKDIKVVLPVVLDKVTLNVYDITNDTLISDSQLLHKKDADNKPIQPTLTLDTKDIKSDALILTTFSANNSTNNSVYYDPLLNKTVPMPANKPMLALSQGINSINASPLTTMAYYRALAVEGWFFEHEELPTAKELAAFIKNPNRFFASYNKAITEYVSAFGFRAIGLPSIHNINDLFIRDASTKLNTWIDFLAHLNIYRNSFDNVDAKNAPFVSFAHDLSYDFYDGDIDGATIKGAKWLKGGIHTFNNPMVNNITITDPNIRKPVDVYLSQQPVLLAYEKKLNKSARSVAALLGVSLFTEVLNFLEFFDTTDATETLVDKTQKRSYADFNAGIIYRGIGNKTLAFGLPDGINQQTEINADDITFTTIDTHGIEGKYGDTNCSLQINKGVVRFSHNGKSYQAFIDREQNDSIYRVTDNAKKNNQVYRVNVSSLRNTTNNQDKLRRFIQITITNNQPTFVATQVTNTANENLLNNPDASCVL